MLDCGNDSFAYREGVRKQHRGYAEFLEPLHEFHAATHRPFYNDKTYPGRARNLLPLLNPDGSPIVDAKGNTISRTVRPEFFIKYIRLSQFIDYDSRQLTAAGRLLVDRLADFNVYSVSEYYGDDATERRVNAVNATHAWLRKYRALARLQRYTGVRDGKTVPMAQLTDGEIATLPLKLMWKILWQLDDEQPEDAELLASLRTYLNVDHHGGIIVKRTPDGGPYPGTGPARLYKFSADGTDSHQDPIVLSDFVAEIGKRSTYNESLFTHYGFFKLRPLRDGGFAPGDAATRAAVARKIDLDALSRFIRWN
ncbi:MAG: hypothetical protein JO180_05370 [Gemmatirosa sp.]|nr:hypothetical protein [Gemmatirosa sp.]